MTDKIFPTSGLPIRKTVDLLPQVFKTSTNDKFMAAVVDPLVQPGVLDKKVGYIGRRYGKTFNGTDIYLDTDNTLRSRYQLEPGVVLKNQDSIEKFYDYLDFKNQLKYFNNEIERDDLITSQEHYSWNPPIDWDMFVNFREYFWVPSGPPVVKVLGQADAIDSTYKVRQQGANVWVLTPDGLSVNPTITLYRGQTYNFEVNSPNEPFTIRTAFDTGSLRYDPNLTYVPKQLAVYDNKLWRAKTVVTPGPNNVIVEGPDWELVDASAGTSRLDYNNGVTNNGVIKGTLTFEVPLDSPDVLYYQSATNPDRFGRFIIADIEDNTSINVQKEIIGKQTYTSSNGIKFTSGLVVQFAGKVTPKKYASGRWLIENVGTEITLINVDDLVVPTISNDIPEVLFDNAGFDEEPFDDATAYPGTKDYITVCRASIDSNPWSRYNRWFHRSVLDYAHKLNGTDFSALDSSRAKRPIIEFKPNIQLFNHCSVAKQSVDFIDDFTTDVFSTVEGSSGYNVDGEFLFQGARILVTADKDSMANNKIYMVDFITHNNVKQIALRTTDDSESLLGEGVLVKRGNKNKGLMYHFDGSSWIKSQEKLDVNQAPLFDIFNSSGVSFSDVETYPVSTFAGSKLLSYVQGTSTADTELGFSLSYLNIDNVGDILFNFDFDTDSFAYTVSQKTTTVNLNTGFYRFNPYDTFDNGWLKSDPVYAQPILDSVVITEQTSQVTLSTLNWEALDQDVDARTLWYLNAKQIAAPVSRAYKTFTFDNTFAVNDVVSVRIYTKVSPDQGYYKIPMGLERNPLNEVLSKFTLGQAIDHISTALELDPKFSGSYPGVSNLRDINGYQNKGMRFLKHSGISPMAISLLCDKDINIVKSLQYSARHFSEFKYEFLKIADTLYNDENVADYVDEILASMGRAKTSSDPFADSDMVGTGAHTKINYTVEDEGIKVFALSEKFDLTELSRRAVYVYLNGQQLIAHADYEFDSTFGFVRILTDLVEGDQIEIREYVSTSFCFMPVTPTKLGLYKKYLPQKFLDDTYQEPRWVIQGHDGSITAAYNNYKDDLLLELEFRIYNNITQEYNEDVFDIDAIFGGYYGNSLYSKYDLDSVINQEFLKWVANSDLDYTSNAYFDRQNSFTYTYSNMTDPSASQNLPGYWRGVYQWFYDTDRPHRCPWEMLGFSEKPTWWESEYGPAPYTKNNLLLWEDIRDGVIRQGTRAGTHDRYKHPTIMEHIPVDGDGKLLSPLDSGLAGNFTLVNNAGDFRVGDVAPVEYAWRSSSEYPFAIIIALCLLKPFEFITDSFDRSRIELNQLGQTVSSSTGVFFKLSDLVIPEIGGTQASGLISYVASYIRSRNLDPAILLERFNNLDVKLSTRMSGFVDQTEQKFLLDSKNPKSTTSNIFVPPENYDIIFNVSTPVSNIAYSGVLIEKRDEGWRVRGYDPQIPYFMYYKAVKSTTDPYISVGGKSETFLDWESGKTYNNGALVRIKETFYRALKTHTSGTSFDATLWRVLPQLPTTGAVQAYFRKTFNMLQPSKMVYGTVLTTIQDVVDFLLGYEQYLKSVGFNFERYDAENQIVYNWQTSAREFMFWTKHNWTAGSLLSLSPSAKQVDISISLGVADSLFDSFYDYQIFKSDGTQLTPHYIDVKRDFQSVSVSTVDTNDGIFFIRMHFVLKEHVTVFDDRTVFNDVIYDKTTGYRQERIRSRGFRTTDWDGDYTSPGFLFDNVKIDSWEPYVDYKLGDIVSYRSYNWTSLENQNGIADFDDTKWSKLDTTPVKGLVSNFDYRINQFEDYYEADADGLGSSQRELSRHVIGYQTREYLQNIAEDNVTQFKIYQGFIREKGTANSVTKVFDKLSRTSEGSVTLNEEWAFRVGRLGGLDQFKETEFRLEKNQFAINPQPILIAPPAKTTDILDQYLRVPEANFTISSGTFTKDINPTRKYEMSPRVAGYVNNLHVDYVIKNRDDILSLDITKFEENMHVWVTFDSNSWTVLRYNKSPLLIVEAINVNKTIVEIVLNRPHGLAVGDIFGVRQIQNMVGFHKITAVTTRSITVEIAKEAKEPKADISSIINIELFTESRYPTYQAVDLDTTAYLTEGARLWIDSNESGNWEVVEKQNQFSYKGIFDYGTSEPLGNGTSVVYNDVLTQTITGMPGSNLVVAYIESTDGLKPLQLIEPATAIAAGVNGVFGSTVAMSQDGRWLAVGSPYASGIKSDYIGEFSPTATYTAGDIVLASGKLWRAKENIAGDGSTISIASDMWEPATVVTANELGANDGYFQQGAVTLYEWSGQNWVERYSFVSPRQSAKELFGSQITLGQTGSNYYMAISAPGALDNRGRVYLYKYAPVTTTATLPIIHEVTVGAAVDGESGYKFYIDGVYRSSLTFLVGNTYIFDQSSYTNVFFPNPETSTVVNPHPLNFSADSINGELGGGTTYETGVTYLLDNVAVTQDEYIAGFNVATTRKVQVEVTDKTASVLYYWSSRDSDAGAAISRRYPTIAKEWKQLENENYKGVYSSTVVVGSTEWKYPVGSIVWYDNNLWQSLEDQNGGTNIPDVNSTAWTKLDPISTQCSLPTNASVDDDGSTLGEGLLSPDQMAELIKQDDGFGSSIAMNRDGSILVVGAPNSDGQYFANYKGQWNSYQEYTEGDVVKHNTSYYRLAADSATSSYTSIGQSPIGAPWELAGNTVAPSTGKIFIYQRSVNDLYVLKQTITSADLSTINESGSTESIETGDLFGFALDVDYTGTTIVASSPRADRTMQNQGAVFVFRTDSISDVSYMLKQKLQSFETLSNELFGYSVSISERTERIVIGAKNTPFRLITRFDTSSRTTFDGNRTRFSEDRGYPGQVYVFELKDQTYLLADKLQATLSVNESFGYSVDSTSSVIVVGSPNYKPDVLAGNFVVGRSYTITKVGTTNFLDIGATENKVGIVFTATGSGTGSGTAITFEAPAGLTRIFRKDPATNYWNVIGQETNLVNIDLLKSISLFDEVNKVKLADIDIVDHAKLKLIGRAEEELRFKTPYDPAVYTNGTSDVEVDEDQAWFEKNVGQLWWNTNTVKWIQYEQGDVAYRTGNWNKQAVGSSIDIYEWVESPVSPSEWAKLADTTNGLANNISGQPAYGNAAYSVKVFINPNTGLQSGTKYYFWVKNKTIVPQGVPGRRISASDVATLINNPAVAGTPLLAIIDSDKFLAYNFNTVITSDSALFNIEYYKADRNPNLIHNEYQLLVEGAADSLPTASLEKKWLDSLIGFNGAGQPVPDPTLTAKQRYGIAFRPIQTMFVNRADALKMVVTNVNLTLKTKPFTDLIDFENLNTVDPVPSELLNLYDVKVDNLIELAEVGTVRVKRALLSVNIVDGEIDTIDIVNPGFGYKVAPPVVITGNGQGAKAEVTLDNQGRVVAVTVVLRGRKYSYASAEVRNFSVLVVNDSTVGNAWSINAWDTDRQQYFKSSIQSYDTTQYWSYIDWYAEGYGVTSKVIKEISSLYMEPTIASTVEVGDIVRIKEYGNGGWAMLERVEEGTGSINNNYTLVGRKNGTIQIDSTVFNTKVYDASPVTYDEQVYDKQPSKELRFIFKAIKENIFIDDLSVEWNKLFFNSIRYVFSEQVYVDWAFKTSFLNAIHDVGSFEQRPTYKNDNLESFQSYLEEVKPFRTTIREYTSRYTGLNHMRAATTDFDLPPEYSVAEGRIVPVTETSSEIENYPWKSWADNRGYSVTEIRVSNAGADYRTPPKVVFEGDGVGAEAQAYISNGSVSGIKILNAGSGFTSAPKISLVGGNGTSQNVAKAIAVIGDGKVRTFNTTVKFDRISKTGLYSSYTKEETYVADGSTASFNLTYPPTRDKTKISVVINNELVLRSDYKITLYSTTNDAYTLLRGKLVLNALPTKGDVIVVKYDISDDLIDSVDRINKYYSPTAGMIGKDAGQLMTGIDFGGVMIQGTTFDVSGGWDALPWFTDNWDSVEPSSDFYVVADGSTNDATLPAAPAENQVISIYIKRATDQKTVRIDDPNFGTGTPITNKNAVMPSFVGDGSTVTVEIGTYVRTEPGDTLIFRPIESDGSVVINDPNIIDTNLSGGSFGAYSTATGMLAEDIVVDGSNFISPDQVPAPEENVPGQVLDSVSIKVFHTVQTGAAPLQSVIRIADGSENRYPIGQRVLEASSVVAYIDKIKQGATNEDSSIDYEIDYTTNEVVFITAPEKGSVVEIISIGIGGVAILDYQEFIADGETSLFLTRADFSLTKDILVTVDGEETTAGFIDSTGLADTTNKTMVKFPTKPEFRQVVKIVCLGAPLDTDATGKAVVRVNQQQLHFEGSTRTFALDTFVNLTRASAAGAMLVEVNGVQLTGVDTNFAVYNGTNNVVTVGEDPAETFATITEGNIKVYINNEVKRFILDYVYDGNTNTVTISKDVLNVGDEIKVEVDLRSLYTVSDNNIVLSPDLNLTTNSKIIVTWFSEYPSMNIVTDQFTGGKVHYQLSRQPVSASYVWVYRNGERLTEEIDYDVIVPRNVVYLKNVGTVNDTIKIVQFGTEVHRAPVGYEVFKDMLNIYHYKRFSMDRNVVLAQDLAYYDQEIVLTDATHLFRPIKERNIPGVVYIGNERIEYFAKTDRVLSQLRRGSFGTAIATVHTSGTEVVDLSPSETVPYNEVQDRVDFISDGSSLLIGPLEYVPAAATRTSWERDTIPETYEPCDQVEVFVGGRRLRKDPVAVYDETLGVASPAADKVLEAEFSVDGINAYIRLTQTVAAGTRITVIRRTGNTWYDPGTTAASSGVTLEKNTNPVMKFLSQKSTELPE